MTQNPLESRASDSGAGGGASAWTEAQLRSAWTAAVGDHPGWVDLLAQAWQVRHRAYAPYSGFAVGASLLTAGDLIFSGVNVENASYPVGCCAERSAVCAAVTAGQRQFRTIAIVTDAEHPAAPCGLCRQNLAEFGLDLQVVLGNTTGLVWHAPLRELLPAAFTPDSFEPRPGRQ